MEFPFVGEDNERTLKWPNQQKGGTKKIYEKKINFILNLYYSPYLQFTRKRVRWKPFARVRVVSPQVKILISG